MKQNSTETQSYRWSDLGLNPQSKVLIFQANPLNWEQNCKEEISPYSYERSRREKRIEYLAIPLLKVNIRYSLLSMGTHKLPNHINLCVSCNCLLLMLDIKGICLMFCADSNTMHATPPKDETAPKELATFYDQLSN